VGIKIILFRLLWIITSVASYAAAVQLTISSESYFYGGVLGGLILFVGLFIILHLSKTPTRLLTMLLIPVVGGAASYITLLNPHSVGLLYVVWQSLVSLIIISGIKSIDNTKTL
jgi:hypothetical protein